MSIGSPSQLPTRCACNESRRLRSHRSTWPGYLSEDSGERADLRSGLPEDMRIQSLRKAGAYTAANIRKLWERLLSGKQTC